MPIATWSKQVLTGNIKEYLLEAEKTVIMPEDQTPTILGAGDIGSLISLRTQNLSKLTELNAVSSGDTASRTF